MGESLGRFELLGQIATGGMAEIHMARQRGMEGFEKLVVIKRLLPELAERTEIVNLFLNEARIAARLNHPNVIQIYDLGKERHSYYIAMEYIQGENLRIVLKSCAERERLLPLQHALEIARQVCEGLHYAHTKKDVTGQPLDIVHCDISPQNILVSFDGVAKVVDFGIARAAATLEQTDPGRVRGKHSYMSPEQCRGKPLDARSDLFSAGVVFWELCTARRLFKRSSPVETFKAIVSGTVISPRKYNPLISEDLEAVIMCCLDTDPDRRFQTALQMGMAIDKELNKLPQESGSMQLGVFMRRLFSDKLENLQRIEEARARGEQLEDDWYLASEDSSSSVSSSSGTDSPQPSVSAPAEKREPVQPPGEQAGSAKGRSSGRRALRLGLVAVLGLILLTALGVLFHTQLKALFGLAGEPTGARIEINSTPAGAAVFLDDEQRCTTPCEVPDLEVEVEHRLRVVKPGYQAWSTLFTLSRGEAVRLFELQLAKKLGKSFGQIEVITDPPGARVELDGKLLPNVTPLVHRRVPANRKHTLRAWIDVHRVWVTTFRLKRGEKKVLRGVLPEP